MISLYVQNYNHIWTGCHSLGDVTNQVKNISQNVGDVTKKVESISKAIDSLVSDKQPAGGKKILSDSNFVLFSGSIWVLSLKVFSQW